MDIVVGHEFDDTAFVPAHCRGWMLMEEMPSLIELLLVDLRHELQVHTALSHKLGHSIGIHLWIVHVLVPNTEHGARRRSHNKVWMLGVDVLHSHLPI